MFRDREQAAQRLADRLRARALEQPLVLAIPRGGVVTGAVLARELGAELDVVLARKLRAPQQPELALGSIGEDGEVYLGRHAEEILEYAGDYLATERGHQMAEINRRQRLFRGAKPQASLAGRSIILTDDGIATGSTMVAALHVIRAQHPKEIIVAVPVAPPDRLQAIRKRCDDLVCLLMPEDFWAVGQFYADFREVSDEEVVSLLRYAAEKTSRWETAQPGTAAASRGG